MTRRNMTAARTPKLRDGYEHLIPLTNADTYRVRIADLEDQIRDREATVRLLKAQLLAIQDT